MKELVIGVERTGFPIKIAGIEFFFDASVEGMERYENNYIEALAKVEDIEETGSHLEDRKKILTESYDTILEPGAFAKIYKKVPDVIALTEGFFNLIKGIESHVQELVEENDLKAEELAAEYEEKYK